MAETYSRRPQRCHPIDLKRQVVEEFLSGDYSLNSLAKRHDVSRALIRYWVGQHHGGELNDNTIPYLLSMNRKMESLVVRQAIEINALREKLAALSF